MGALGKRRNTAWGRGDAKEREMFPPETNAFQVEGTAAHWAGPTVRQALAQATGTRGIHPHEHIGKHYFHFTGEVS